MTIRKYNNKRKILFVSSTLGGGGAERVMTSIIDATSMYNDYDVLLLLLKNSTQSYVDTLPKNVKIIRLNIIGRIRNNIIKVIIEILKIHPSICFLGLDKFNRLFAIFLPFLKIFGIKFIVRETNVLSEHFGNPNWITKLYYRFLYNKYDTIIAQSKDMAEDLANNWKVKKNRIALINNPIDYNKVLTQSLKEDINCFDQTKINIVAVGRLSYQKGFDILIDRISKVDTSKIRIYIIGEGDERSNLEKMIEKYELKDVIILLGFKSNPYPYIRKADALILSSRYEGFPNVLLESCSLGTPVFCNSCKGGINEIVNENNGIIANFSDQVDFESRFNDFISTKFNRNDIMTDIYNRFGKDIIMPQFMHIFKTL